MADTLKANTNSNSSSASHTRQHSSGHAHDLLCRVKYSNTLPDIPFDPKFVKYPFNGSRFVTYKPTSLEHNYKYDILTEPDLGIKIDLILPETYPTPSAQTELTEEDEKLLAEDDSLAAVADTKRSRQHARSVSWLRRTEYISTELTRFQPQCTRSCAESRVGFSVRRRQALHDSAPVCLGRSAQIEAIERSFVEAKCPVTAHYSKPGVYAVAEMALLPDFELWKYPCAQVVFDADPAPQLPAQHAHTSAASSTTSRANLQLQMMSQAMIRGVMDESGEQFVAYFLPVESTLAQRQADLQNGVQYVDDFCYEYMMHREYNWNVKNKACKGYEENYFFVTRDNTVYYNELETRVRLSKRRLTRSSTSSNSRLLVTHRPVNDDEWKLQRYRERQLEMCLEEDEEIEDAGDGNEDDQEESTTRADNDENPEASTFANDVDGSSDETSGSGSSSSSSSSNEEEEDNAGNESSATSDSDRLNSGQNSDSAPDSSHSK